MDLLELGLLLPLVPLFLVPLILVGFAWIERRRRARRGRRARSYPGRA